MHISEQRLDLSNEFTQPPLSPELLSKYLSTHFPPLNHVNFRYQNLPNLHLQIQFSLQQDIHTFLIRQDILQPP